MSKTVMFVGPGRCGKDTACAYVSQVTGLRNAGTTSKYLTPYVARKLGINDEEAYYRRHESDAMRKLWFDTGNEVRQQDPLLLVKEALKHGEITGGIRDYVEVSAVWLYRPVDLLVWIDRDVPDDPTLKFDRGFADIVVDNTSSISMFYERLRNLCRFAGLEKPLNQGAGE